MVGGHGGTALSMYRYPIFCGASVGSRISIEPPRSQRHSLLGIVPLPAYFFTPLSLSRTDSKMKFTAASVIVGLTSAQAFMVQPTMKTSGP